MVKRIKLSNIEDKEALVDDEDYELVTSVGKFAYNKLNNSAYSTRSSTSHIFMHDLIMENLPDDYFPDDDTVKISDNLVIIHLDGNNLNNCRKNLKIVPLSCALKHKTKCKSYKGHPTSSIYKGVCWHRRDKSWQVLIGVDGKHVYVGRSKSEVEAAKMYDAAALKYFGHCAKLNFPEGT